MEKFQDAAIQAKNIFWNYYRSKSLRIASYVLCECLYIQWVLQSLPEEDRWTSWWKRIMENTTDIIAFQRVRINNLLIDSDIEKCPAITSISGGLTDIYSKYLTVYLLETKNISSLLRRYFDPIKERVPLLKMY